jgi:predicted ATPase
MRRQRLAKLKQVRLPSDFVSHQPDCRDVCACRISCAPDTTRRTVEKHAAVIEVVMTDSQDDLAGTAQSRGAEPSIIEAFGIEGLYRYRSISLASEYAATILIAKNGTGKTTLLGALDAFLRMQFSRLRNLEFSEIHCKLRAEDEELVLSHNDVVEFLQVPTDGELVRLSSRSNLEPATLFTFLTEDWAAQDEFSLSPSENRAFGAVLSAFNYNRRDTATALNKARASLSERQPNVAKIQSVLDRALSGIDIVYLPTYRRVELALRGDDPHEPPHRRRRPRFDVAAGSLFTGEIQFGLSDISERLSQLNRQIILESNSGYRKISADIINELIDGSFENEETSDSDVPSPEELKLFFERLERGRQQGPFMPISVPNLDKIYTGEGVPTSSSRFLNYFLTKLATVIRSTKDLEMPVNGFINSCNKYLMSAEPSTVLGQGQESFRVIDGKELKVNRSNLRIHVESAPEGRRISLDALSSGEKQMISLFAKMFLYNGRKVVLIDEPELSLSIDWQKDILVDVLNAPLCGQLIAITHSPFVFDNELEPFARALQIGRVDVPFDPEEEEEATESDLDG